LGSPDASSHLTELEAAGQSLGVNLLIVKVADEAEFENAFARLNEQQIRALLISADPLFLAPVEHIAGLANQFKIAALYSGRTQAVAGG
jgi:hypothetical protein